MRLFNKRRSAKTGTAMLFDEVEDRHEADISRRQWFVLVWGGGAIGAVIVLVPVILALKKLISG